MENLLNEFEIIIPQNQYYTLLDTDNRITMVTAIKQQDEQFLFNYPEGFDFGSIHDYKIVDEELIHEPVIYPEPEPQPTMEEQFEEYKIERTEFEAEVLYELSMIQLGMM